MRLRERSCAYGARQPAIPHARLEELRHVVLDGLLASFPQTWWAEETKYSNEPMFVWSDSVVISDTTREVELLMYRDIVERCTRCGFALDATSSQIGRGPMRCKG